MIQLRQIRRIRRLRDEIDNGLVRGQRAGSRLGKARGLFDDQIRIVLDLFTELLLSQTGAMLLGKPEDHLVANEDTQVLL